MVKIQVRLKIILKWHSITLFYAELCTIFKNGFKELLMTFCVGLYCLYSRKIVLAKYPACFVTLLRH